MTLDDLPQFTILAIADPSGAPHLEGRFSRLDGVRVGRGWLYHPTEAVVGDLDALDAASCRGVFAAPFWTPDSPAQVGATLPWLDGYWQPYQLKMILAPTGPWESRTFAPSPAQYFRLHGVVGWQPLGKALPTGATPLQVRQDAWDHEHCELCGDKIGHGGAPTGFVNPDDRWLCTDCYAKYGSPRDLGFLSAT